MNKKFTSKQPEIKYGQNKLAINEILKAYSKNSPKKVINLFYNFFKFKYRGCH